MLLKQLKMCISKERIGLLKLICAMNATDSRSFRVQTFFAER
jgi:hypothetical protein